VVAGEPTREGHEHGDTRAPPAHHTGAGAREAGDTVTGEPAGHRQLEVPGRQLPGRGKGAALEELLEELVAGAAAGTLLPSERAIAERFGLARMTVRNAIGALVAKGLLYRVQGQGTFVAEPRITQPAALTSFSEDMRARGMEPSALMLAQETLPAHEDLARALRIPSGQPVVRIERIRLGDSQPVAIERAHLPAKRFPGLEEADLEQTSLYQLLSERYGCTIAMSDQRIAAVQLTATEADLPLLGEHDLDAEEGDDEWRLASAEDDEWPLAGTEDDDAP
jgi:GntR family transcriptional regulator